MVLGLELLVDAEAVLRVDGHQLACLLRVMRCHHVSVALDFSHLHGVWHRKIGPDMRMAELVRGVARIEQHVVLDGLDPSA